jgi:hypothetical protein
MRMHALSLLECEEKENGMAELSEDQFLQRYGHLIVQSWAMPAFKERLQNEPAEVLKECGLDSGGARITLLSPGQPNPLGLTGESTAESQYRMWVEGKRQGNIPLYVVDEPPEGAGAEALSDEELMGVAGGRGWGQYCCCCTPCCCC